MRLALAVLSVVVLGINGVVFYDQFFHRWERHQTAYFEDARTLAKTAAEKADLAARTPRIEQIIVTQFGEQRVDRCTTCHIAADDPRFGDHVEPIKTHPYSAALGDVQRGGRWERRHKFADFGCTVCHDGQGRGLETVDGHGEDPYWPEPLLGYVTQAGWRYAAKLKDTTLMEANCAQCHTDEGFKGTPHVARGRQLFFRYNCYGCHKIEGLSDGTLAPELSEVGRKWKVDYLWESIADPRANMATSFMPQFNMPEEDMRDLVVFLKSRRGVNYSETSLARYRARLGTAKSEPAEPEPAAAGASLVDRGRAAVSDRACTACHRLGGADGGIAPDLSFEGLIKEPAWIGAHFKDPRSVVPDSIMPAFRFTAGEFSAMTAYLATLTTPPAAMTPERTFATLCARCHGEKGDGKGRIALYLDPAPRDLTKVAFMNSKPRERFLRSIADGVPGTSMPAWRMALGEDRIDAVFSYVEKAIVKDARQPRQPRTIPDVNPAPDGPDSIARGNAIFLKRCTGCHGRKADGKGPNSIDMTPRPRNLRNHAFVNRLTDQRLIESILYSVEGTAMPAWIDYGLTPQDAGDLVRFIRSLNTGR
ncbi:MAG TPA: c-type cytochrome [Vicinamibacterales bacterium]|nr:c-type cytochrome [Vicinamibacterales bacterium]